MLRTASWPLHDLLNGDVLFFPSSSALHIQIMINKVIIQWQPHVRNSSIWAGGSKCRVTLQAIRRLRKRTPAFRRLPADRWGTLWIVTRVIRTSYKTRLDFITQEVQAFLHFWVFLILSEVVHFCPFFSHRQAEECKFPPFWSLPVSYFFPLRKVYVNRLAKSTYEMCRRMRFIFMALLNQHLKRLKLDWMEIIKKKHQ